MYKIILVAINIYSKDNTALKKGLQLAKKHQAQLHILYALPFQVYSAELYEETTNINQDISKAYHDLEVIAKTIMKDYPDIKSHIAHAETTKYAIVSYAGKIHADLIIMGDSHQKHNFLDGSIIKYVISHCDKNVLIINTDEVQNYKKLLFYVDTKEIITESLKTMVNLITIDSSNIYLLCIIPKYWNVFGYNISISSNEVYAKMKKELNQAKDTFNIDEQHAFIQYGDSISVLTEYINKIAPDLIVFKGKTSEAYSLELELHHLMFQLKKDFLYLQ